MTSKSKVVIRVHYPSDRMVMEVFVLRYTIENVDLPPEDQVLLTSYLTPEAEWVHVPPFALMAPTVTIPLFMDVSFTSKQTSALTESIERALEPLVERLNPGG